MNVTARGMICGRSCAPLRVPRGGAVEHPTEHVRLLAGLERAEGERPTRVDRQRGEHVELGHARRSRAPGVMVPSAIAWITPWPAWPTAAASAPSLLASARTCRARPCPSCDMWARKRLLEKPAAPASNASSHDAGHLGDLVGRGVLVVVGPLAHHVVAQRTVGDVARDVGGVAAAVEHVEVLGEGLPLAPRHAVGEGGAGDVLDAFHHVDELTSWSVGRTGREADAAVAEHDGGDAVGGRRLERVVPRDLAVVVRVQVEEAGRDERAVGVDLLARRPRRPRRRRRCGRRGCRRRR